MLAGCAQKFAALLKALQTTDLTGQELLNEIRKAHTSLKMITNGVKQQIRGAESESEWTAALVEQINRLAGTESSLNVDPNEGRSLTAAESDLLRAFDKIVRELGNVAASLESLVNSEGLSEPWGSAEGPGWGARDGLVGPVITDSTVADDFPRKSGASEAPPLEQIRDQLAEPPRVL